jgi:uncharacterized protein YqgC (DUF456 family)
LPVSIITITLVRGGYLHRSCWCAVGLIIDLLAGALGVKRVAASPQAVLGALLGTAIGLFFGLPGVISGPFLGAVLGELAAGSSVPRSTNVGVNAWLGLIFGAIVNWSRP